MPAITARNRRPATRCMLALALLVFTPACGPLYLQKVTDMDSIAHYPATGGVMISLSRKLEKAVCVAPPAQAAMDIKLNVKHDGKVNVLKYVEVETQNALDLSKTLAKLYEQNERTLFLQFSLYRLCEAYANGMLDQETYAESMQREALEIESKLKSASARLAAAEEDSVSASKRVKELEPAYTKAVADRQKAEGELKTAEAELRERDIDPAATSVLNDATRKMVRRYQDAKQAVDASRLAVEHDYNAAKIAEQRAAAQLGEVRSQEQALKSADVYAKELAELARTQELEKLAAVKPDDVLATKQQMSRVNYTRMFERVLSTAETLAKMQVEIARAEADRARAEAEVEKLKQATEKAKADAEKAKASEEAKKTASKLEALQQGLVDAAVSRVGGCDEKCQAPAAAAPKGAGKGPMANTISP